MRLYTLPQPRQTAMTQHETVITPYVLYFDESLLGLSVGAPVTYRGLPVGEVTAVGLEYDPAKELIRPALISSYIHPGSWLM